MATRIRLATLLGVAAALALVLMAAALAGVAQAKTIGGTPGNDYLLGTIKNDLIRGRGGDDYLRTLAGNDLQILRNTIALLQHEGGLIYRARAMASRPTAPLGHPLASAGLF
jgi:Ca2+-binding RTX toxin-like protein